MKVLKKLDEKKQDKPEWKAACFPAGGQSLSYGRGDSMTVETTALAALAMLRTKQFSNDANKAFYTDTTGYNGTRVIDDAYELLQKLAQELLDQAKKLLKDGDKAAARKRLTELIRDCPNTPAAKQALDQSTATIEQNAISRTSPTVP